MPSDLWKAVGSLGFRGGDMVVHLGAGDGRGDTVERDLAFRRRVLVEGDPAAAALLQARLRHRPDTRVMSCVVGPTDGDAVWFAHSVAFFDGLVRQDVVLRDRFPRLRCVSQKAGATVSLRSVLERCLDGATPEGNHVLLIDLPLTEQEWLPTEAAATLARFRALVVTPAARNAAQDGPPVALHAALTAAGFMDRAHDAAGHLVFELDPLTRQLRQQYEHAISLLSDLQKSVALLRAAGNERQADLTQAQNRVAQLEAEVHRVRSLLHQNARQHKEVRHAVTQADGAVRALASILRPGPGDAA